MNPAVSHLLCLRQGDRAMEDYVQHFCGLCDLVGFNDMALKDTFHVGLNDVQLRMPGDYALLPSGFSYTVGLVDEEPCYSPVSTTPEHLHVMSGIIYVTTEFTEPAHAMPATPGPVYAISPAPEPAYSMFAAPGPAHTMSAAPGPAHAMSAAPGPVHATLVKPESEH
ncbi:hypothetical protein M9458_030608, partial [Cirrhinus mrigala]